MNVLVLHNDNIPNIEKFKSIKSIDGSEVDIDVLPCKMAIDDIGINFDTWISSKLERIFNEKKYDIILLPYSLSVDNYMEYTGLRVAMHIRLTPAWNHCRKPILFVGGDDVLALLRIVPLSCILNTPGVYCTDKREMDDFKRQFCYINKNKANLSDEDYNKFLERVTIQPPANYADSHHAIANEWAIMRWFDLFNWGGNEPVLNNGDFKSMLYFKYLIAKERDKENKVKNNKKETPNIPNISGKRFVYIDDEYNKGWGNLLTKIFENSGAKLYVFQAFEKKMSQDQLLHKIMNFIQQPEYKDVEGYIIDLRLCEDDFILTDADFSKLSGHKLSEAILKENRGRQIILLTASNKFWNYRKEKSICGYVLKESPEQNYSRDSSLQLYNEFARCVQKSARNSCFQNFVESVRQLEGKISDDALSLMNSYIDVALISEQNLISTNIYTMCTLIELMTKELEFSCCDGSLYKGEKCILQYIDRLNDSMVAIVSEDKYKSIKEIFFYKNKEKQSLIKQKGYSLPPKKGDSSKVFTSVMMLKYYYNLSDQLCNKYLFLKYSRNKQIHDGNKGNSIDYINLRDIFENIILPIYQKK